MRLKSILVFSVAVYSFCLGAIELSPKEVRETCGRLLGQEQLDVEALKALVLATARHPSIQNRKLKLDSKGQAIEFLLPLIEQMLVKTRNALLPMKASRDLNFDRYAQYEKSVIEKIEAKNFTYQDILFLPLELGYFLDQPENDVFQEWESRRRSLRFSNYNFNVLVEEKGVYPLPMFIMPSIELRSRLWSLNTPPLSIIAREIYSRLDQRSYSPSEYPQHDFQHAESYGNHIGSMALKKSGASLKILSHVQKEIIQTIENWPSGKREVAFFLLHCLFPEDHLFEGMDPDFRKPLTYSQKIIKNVVDLAEFYESWLYMDVSNAMKDLKFPVGLQNLPQEEFKKLVKDSLRDAIPVFTTIIEKYKDRLELG